MLHLRFTDISKQNKNPRREGKNPSIGQKRSQVTRSQVTRSQEVTGKSMTGGQR